MKRQTTNSPTPVLDRSENVANDVRHPTREEIRQKNLAAIAVLDSFLLEDADEQAESLAYLMQALDEDRPEGQKLFS
jgi:hypothetical protein